MEVNGWLEDSLDACCTRYFSWAYELCMNGGGDSLAHTDKYFVDFSSGSCLKDCAPGSIAYGCAQVPPPVALYDTIDACCEVGQPWVDRAFCLSRSDDDYSDGWTIDYSRLHEYKVW